VAFLLPRSRADVWHDRDVTVSPAMAYS